MKYARAILLLAAAAMLGAPGRYGPTLQEKSETRLAKLLAGRVAGTPVNCIRVLNTNRLSTFEFVGIVYDFHGTVWVSRVEDPDSLRRGFVPVMGLSGRKLCASDIGQAVSRDGYSSTVRMSLFVPYTKPE
jgi:hypothetical protein